MSIFALEKMEEIKDDGELSFYKISVDDNCLFDQFQRGISCLKPEMKSFKKILACMNWMAESNQKLPRTKFNSIKYKQNVIGYEFKEQNLRVYVLKIDPNVFVVLGGFKKSQSRDINNFVNLILDEGLLDFVNNYRFNE